MEVRGVLGIVLALIGLVLLFPVALLGVLLAMHRAELPSVGAVIVTGRAVLGAGAPGGGVGAHPPVALRGATSRDGFTEP